MDWGAGLEHYFESSTIFLQMVQSRTPDEIIFKTGEESLFRRLVEQNGTFFRLFAGLITLFMVLNLIKRIGFGKSLKWIRTSSSSRLSKSIDNLPGPKSSAKWFIGNALELSSSSSNDLFKTFQLWCEKYGPCFAFKIFNQNVVWLNSASMVQKLLSSEDNGHLHKSSYFYEIFVPFWNDGLVVSRAEKWKVRRKIMAKAFTHKSLLSYAHVFNKEAKELVNELERLFPPRQNVDGWKGNQVNKLLWSCALRVICETTMGSNVWEFQKAKQLTETLHVCKTLCMMRLLKPWLRLSWLWYFHPRSKELSRGVYQLQELTIKIIKTKKAQLTANKSRIEIKADEESLTLGAKKPFRSMIEEMLDAGIDDEGIREEVQTFITAGYETTATTLQFLMFILALHPEHQAKCREEVDRVFGDVSLCPNGELGYEALASLKHLERCIFETLRLFPVTVMFFRKLESPLKLDEEIELPKGTNVCVLVEGIHHNPQYYPDPLQFKPERFLAENSQSRSQFAYIPFSAGPRNCIGYKFGLMEVKLMMAWILRHFLVSTTDKMGDVNLIPDIVLTPERGYNFILSKRQSKNCVL